MKARWGIESNYTGMNYVAYIIFEDKDKRYMLEKEVEESIHHEFMYAPNSKQYQLVNFSLTERMREGLNKTSLRKTWKSLAEQGWTEDLEHINTLE